mgnify:FL=1
MIFLDATDVVVSFAAIGVSWIVGCNRERKRKIAQQILAREQFRSALSRRLQLEMRKPSAAAKKIASRIAASTPRSDMKPASVKVCPSHHTSGRA